MAAQLAVRKPLDPAARDKQRREKQLEIFQVPEIYKFDFENAQEKPWLENGRDNIEKYFNYGFTEETWKLHAQDVLSRSAAAEALAQNPELQKKDPYKKNPYLNFFLPHQFGGFGDPLPTTTI